MGRPEMFRHELRFEFILLAATLAFLVIFAGVPFFYTVFLSFQEIDPFEINRFVHEWTGLENYREVLDNSSFGQVTRNTLIFLALSVTAQFCLGFLLALLLRKVFWGSSIVRGLFLVAWIIPQIAVGIIWVSIFAQKAGVLNYFLDLLGVSSEGFGWLTTADLSLYSVSVANIWLGIPFNMIFLTVGLMAIPEDLYEAARVDGAGPLRRFRYITLPTMVPTMVMVLSLGIIFTLQQFDLFAAMTNGGPAGSSLVLQYWSWEFSFQTFEIGKGSAIATIMLIFVTLVGGVYVAFSRQDAVQ